MKPEVCLAMGPNGYDHYAHDNCPGRISMPLICSRKHTHESGCYEHPDYDEVSYLEFYHETYIFDEEVYRIEVGQDGIARIRYDTGIITHEDGRTMEIPHACVREWSHVK